MCFQRFRCIRQCQLIIPPIQGNPRPKRLQRRHSRTKIMCPVKRRASRFNQRFFRQSQILIDVFQRVSYRFPSGNLSRRGIVPVTDTRLIVPPQAILRQQHKVIVRPTETGFTFHLITDGFCRLNHLVQILQHRIKTINSFPNRSPSPHHIHRCCQRFSFPTIRVISSRLSCQQSVHVKLRCQFHRIR